MFRNIKSMIRTYHSDLIAVRGDSLLDRGDIDRAMSLFNKAMKLNPKNDTVLNLRAIAWQKKGNLEAAHDD